MTKSLYKSIGIVGGLGPQATIDMYQEIINNTVAKTDQEHIPVFISSIPHAPSRVKAILNNGETPVPDITKAISDLKRVGAEIIIIACNTAHYFQDEIEEKSNTKILSMVDETLDLISTSYPNIKKVGLLGTNATIISGIFDKHNEIEILKPSNTTQENCVDKSIKLIKAGFIDNYTKSLLLEAIFELKNNGAEAIILGCTELPLILKDSDTNIPLINPTKIVAKKAVEIAQLNIKDKPSLNLSKLFPRFVLEN